MDELVDASIYLIDKDGLGAFTLRRIAEVLRISPSSVTSHLTHKKRMTVVITHHLVERLDKELRYRVRSCGAAGLVPASHDDELRAVLRTWLAMVELGRGDDDLAAVVAGRGEDLEDVVRCAFGLDHDDVVTTQTLYAVMTGLWTAMSARSEPMPPAVAKTILRHLCSRMGIAYDAAA